MVSVFGKRLKFPIPCGLSGVLLWLYLDQKGAVLTARTYGSNPSRQKKSIVRSTVLEPQLLGKEESYLSYLPATLDVIERDYGNSPLRV